MLKLIQNIRKGIIFLGVLGLLTIPVSLFAQDVPGTSDADKVAEDAEKRVQEAEAAKGNEKGESESKSTETTSDDTSTTAKKEEPKEESKNSNIYDDGKNVFATSATKFALESSDNLSTTKFVEYKIDDSPFQKYKEPIKIEEEGQHRIVYRSVDQAGNIEPEKVYLVIIDNTPPEINLSTKEALVEDNGFLYGPAKVTVEITASDTYSGVKKIEYAIGEGDFQDYTAAITLDKSGDQLIRYRAVDNLGNATAEKRFQIKIDGEAPVVQISTAKPLVSVGDKKYARRDNVFTVTAKDSSSGIDRIEVKVDGDSEFKPYTNPLVFNVEGSHSIEARAVDKVGNISSVVKLEWVTDDNPPQTTLKPVR